MPTQELYVNLAIFLIFWRIEAHHSSSANRVVIATAKLSQYEPNLFRVKTEICTSYHRQYSKTNSRLIVTQLNVTSLKVKFRLTRLNEFVLRTGQTHSRKIRGAWNILRRVRTLGRC